jgi:gliding motility-associated-like protein
LPDLYSLCAGLRVSLKNNAALGLPPYSYSFFTNNGNVLGQIDGYLLGVKGGITDVYFNVKDMNGCISQNTSSFQVKTYDPVLPQKFNYQAFYKDNLLIPTKLDSGYVLYNWQPELNLNFYDKPNPIFNGENTIDYSLIRTDTTSRCTVVDNYHIDVTRDFIFDLPNAFTPNYDGINDIIRAIANSGIEKINYLRIYNRTGNLVFQTTNIKEGWDGKVAEKIQESDAYYWKAEYVTKLNQVFKKSGSFLLLK